MVRSGAGQIRRLLTLLSRTTILIAAFLNKGFQIDVSGTLKLLDLYFCQCLQCFCYFLFFDGLSALDDYLRFPIISDKKVFSGSGPRRNISACLVLVS